MKEVISPLCSLPIPELIDWNWEMVRSIPIEAVGEPLVQVGLCGERIISSPQYYIQGLDGALPECFLRKGVFLRLLEASGKLPRGFRLVVMDGWRPENLQRSLFEAFRREMSAENPQLDQDSLDALVSKYVALPSVCPDCPSPHITGGAVDISIVDDKGLFLDMGTIFDETSGISRTRFYEDILESGRSLAEKDKDALFNRRLLYHVMTESGFTNYPDEWWHFDYGNQNWAWARHDGEGVALYSAIWPEMRWKQKF